jgi:hypothetical protein
VTASKPLGTYGDGVGTVTPLDHKLAQSGLLAKTSTANLVRSGLFYNGNSTIVSGAANMSYNVAAFTAVLTRGATAGTVLMANDATYNVVTTAAPGSNSRYDVVYVWAREFSIDGTDSNPVIGVVQGTAAASPTVPSLAAFPGAIELARILVPSGVTATNSGTTITQKAPWTATAGGVIPFRTTTERDEGTYNEGQLGWLIDTNALEIYNGSAWVSNTPRVIPSAATNGTVSSAGVVTSTAQALVRVRDAFPTTYRVFRITFDVTTASAGSVVFQLASGATDATTAYDFQRSTALSTTVATVQELNQGLASISPVAVASARHFGSILITDANVTGPTYYESSSTVAVPAAMSATTGKTWVGGMHRTSTAYNSISVYASSGNITVNRLTVEGVS